MQNESASNDYKHKQESDQAKAENGISRVDRVHGGEIVELIMPENIVPEYDTGCRHATKTLDNTGDFDEVTCDNCPMVWVFDKGTVVV